MFLSALWGLTDSQDGDAADLMAWVYSIGLCLERHPWTGASVSRGTP